MFVVDPGVRALAGAGAALVEYGPLLDALPDAVFIHDAATGRILEVNQACLDLFGFAPEALGSLTLYALMAGLPGFTLEDAQQRIQEAQAQGKTEFPWRTRRADGSLFWSEVRLVSAGAGPGRVVAVVRDITDRTQAEEALVWAQERFEKVFRHCPAGIMLASFPDGRVLEVNETLLRMGGYTREDLVGRRTGGLWALPEARLRYHDLLRAQGRVEAFETVFRRRDGGEKVGRLSGELLELPGGPSVLTMIEDITEQRLWAERVTQASEEWQATFDAAGDAITLLDDHGRVLRRNRAAADLACQGRGDPATLCPYQVPTGAHGRQSQAWVSEGRTFDLTLDPILEPDGTLAGIVHIARDVTARKASEAALDRISRLYAALSLVNQSLIKVRHRDELFTNICKALVEGGRFWAAWIAAPHPETRRFLPLASHGGIPEWVGGLDVYASADRARGRGTMGRAFREERPVIANDFDADPRLVPWQGAGRVREFKAVASFPLRGADGLVFGVLCLYAREVGFFTGPEIALLAEVCEGITFALQDLAKDEREKLAQAEQRALEKRLQETEKLESLGNLAGGVAHDMNNVLGAIMGLASMERERAEPCTHGRRALEAIVQACARGRDLVQSLLCFARRDLEELRPVDVNHLLEELVGLLSHTTLQRIQLGTDLDPGLLSVEGDAGALNHAFLNVCVNAVDAMPEGGSLVLRTRNGPERTVVVEFQDTGEGMTEDVLQRVTEPFFTTKPAGKGTGLGLAMTYGTVQAHQGTLTFSSQRGAGTQVRMVFPGVRAASTPAPEVGGGAAQRGLHILLVDDDAMVREAMTEVLTFQGHLPDCAEGGQEALDLLALGTPFDLIILDLNMPGLSGQDVLPHILAMRPGQRVLLSSGYTEASIKGLLEGRPSVRSLSKPFTIHELSLKIRDLTST